MKLAFLIDSYVHPRAGTERQLKLLAEGLHERGHSVELSVLRATSYIKQHDFPFEVDVLDIHRVLSLRSWWRVYRWGRALRARGFEIVQLYFNDAAVLGPVALRLAGLRVVVCRRDMGFWYSKGILAALRLSSWAVDAIVANSSAAGEAACAREWIPRSKLHVIYNGVPPRPDGPRPERTSAVPRIGIVANIRPIKRIDDLVRAFALVLERLGEAELVVVGGGDSSDLERLAEELGVAGRVRFTGSVDNVAEQIASFDVGVLCSESEGLSNALLEYMQQGKPVVATRTGGNVELVSEDESGLLVPVGDPEALAAALLRILQNPGRARAMGDAGAEAIRSEFSVAAMIDRHLDLFRELGSQGQQAGAPRVEN